MLIEKNIISATIDKLHRSLLEVVPVPIDSTKHWSRFAPQEAGVYAIFCREELVYAGETGCLRGRMRDLRRTVNHTLRRSLGADLFCNHPTFRPATAKKKFSPEIETALTEFMCQSLSIRLLPVAFGRTEFEEFLINKYKPNYNKKSKRIQK